MCLKNNKFYHGVVFHHFHDEKLKNYKDSVCIN